MKLRRVFGAVAAVTAITGGLLAPVGTAVADPAHPVRILIVGDSVTHGSTGDWTWRYRLAKHLEARGVDFDFVGPRDDLWDWAAARSGSQEYADPMFDRDHAACWATSFSSPPYRAADLVRQYRPDVILELLGVNDLIGYEGPAEVLQDAADFVGEARSADSDVDVVLGALPQVWFDGVGAFNAGLQQVAASLDTTDARVTTAVPASVLTQYVDTYDWGHLSATGEIKVAAGFADALAGLGVGSQYPRPLPVVANGPRRPAVLQAVGTGRAVVLDWVPPAGADMSYVWMRDMTGGEAWQRLRIPVVRQARWTVEQLAYFRTYAFRVQAAKGTAVAEDILSNEVNVSIQPPRVAGVAVRPISHGLVLTWTEVSEADGYLVSWRPRGHGVRWTEKLVSRPSADLRHLIAGRPYRVRVRGLFAGEPGPPAALDAVPSGPVAAGPMPHVTDPRSDRSVGLTWVRPRHATRFQIWHRTESGWQQVGWTRRTTFIVRSLSGGRVHGFRVRSFHECLPGGWSPRIRVRTRAP